MPNKRPLAAISHSTPGHYKAPAFQSKLSIERIRVLAVLWANRPEKHRPGKTVARLKPNRDNEKEARAF